MKWQVVKKIVNVENTQIDQMELCGIKCFSTCLATVSIWMTRKRSSKKK
jgi:hypothetical protein